MSERNTQVIAVCICVVDALPHEEIWRKWLDSSDRYHAEIWIHAKNPEKLAGQSGWIAARTLRISYEPEWNDIRIVRSMLALGRVALSGDVLTTQEPDAVDYSDKISEEARQNGKPASAIVYATESCLPVKSLDSIGELLFSSESISRLNTIEKKASNGWTREKQWDKVQFSAQYIRKALPGWITISASDLIAILDAEKKEAQWPKFEHVFAPEEFYFPTLLQSLDIDLESRDKPATYSHWNKSSSSQVSWSQAAHPETFTELTTDLVQNTFHHVLFARKFLKSINAERWYDIVIAQKEEPEAKRRRTDQKEIKTDLKLWRPENCWPLTMPRAEPFEHGWFLETHKRVLSQLLNDETTCVIELGSWYGASTQWIANTAKYATVYAIDIWDEGHILNDDHYRGNANSMLKRHPLYPTFLRNLWSFKDRVVPLRLDTVAGLKLLKEHDIQPSIIYIDADHHYHAVKRDILACIRLFPEAILVGDDYGNYEDVKRAVCECAFTHGRRIYVDQHHCWTYAPHLQPANTARIFRPEPPATSPFASLLAGYSKS